MSSYAPALKEALKALGLKKVIGEVLTIHGAIDEKTAGQIVAHINAGGITKIVKTAEVQ
jgi:hypothetical protein